jgi:uncharacterized membrane protein
MPQDRTRKIVVAGVLGAISIFLGLTKLGFIPWFSGASLTILTVPVAIGVVLEGPIVGVAIGLIFGLFSLFQAATAPNGPIDVFFTNPLISVLPRLLIAPVVWLVYKAFKGSFEAGLALAGVAGALTNTVLVLGVLGLVGALPWALVLTVFIVNGLPEAFVCAFTVLAVVSAWKQIPFGRKKGASL